MQTVDFFPPIVDDPRWYGRIAAANSLSDVYAKGGTPLTAMNVVGWPKDLDLELLAEVLAGGLDKIEEAGAVLCGGHTVVDHEIKYGLSVTGMVHPQHYWPNGGARDGDALLLTKPLGMGAVSTAIKKGLATDGIIERAVEVMATLNRAAAEVARAFDVHAATYVTGFGLIGHASEMASAAALALELRTAALPVLDGALPLVRSGALSGGCARGKRHYGPHVQIATTVDAALADMMFDAETSGGLLLAVPVEQASALARRLAEAGVPAHAVVGQFGRRAPNGPLLALV